MTVRSILSARSARPQLEAMLRGLVRAAVYLGRADGQLGEAEVEHLIDSVRKFAADAVGEEHLADLVTVSRLLDEARAARAALRVEGEANYLAKLAELFQSGFRRDALIVARRIVAADGVLAPEETAAFSKLAHALGLSPEEAAAIEVLATSSWVDIEDADHLDEAREQLEDLHTHGWHDAFPELKAAGYELRSFDASIAHTSNIARLRIDLDARERVVHVNVMELNGPGPHVICIYGNSLNGVLSLIDQVKDRVSPATVPQLLSDLVVRCDALFLERDGRLVQVHPSK
jgi:tellurite resistance protein